MNNSIRLLKRVQHKARGFTLVELMVVVAVIAILASIAYPIYLDKVREARRVDAKALLLKAANREEQLYASNNNQYLNSMSALGLTDQTENGFYDVGVVSGTNNGTPWFTLTATAQGDQVNDTCRTMLVDSTGLKTAWTGAAAAQGTNVSSTCW